MISLKYKVIGRFSGCDVAFSVKYRGVLQVTYSKNIREYPCE